MPLYYLSRTVSPTECVGNSLSTINVGFSALDTNLYNLSSYAVASVNFLSADSIFQQTEINFLSATSNSVSAALQTLITTVSSTSASWTSAYNNLIFEKSIRTVTSNSYTFSDTSIILFDCTAASITASLPPALNNNKQYTAKKIDGSVNMVTLSTNPLNLIDGVTSRDISAQYASVTFISNSAGWWII